MGHLIVACGQIGSWISTLCQHCCQVNVDPEGETLSRDDKAASTVEGLGCRNST